MEGEIEDQTNLKLKNKKFIKNAQNDIDYYDLATEQFNKDKEQPPQNGKGEYNQIILDYRSTML